MTNSLSVVYDSLTVSPPESLTFRPLAAKALAQLRSRQVRKNVLGESLGVVSRSDSSLNCLSRPQSGGVGTRFHLSQTNFDEIPLSVQSQSESSPTLELDSPLLNSETQIRPAVPAGLKFCWTRGQSVATEEFISWTRSHGIERGTLTGICETAIELSSQVKIPTGSRVYLRAVTAAGMDVDLTGIVCSVNRVQEPSWQVSCRLIGPVEEGVLEQLLAD